MPLNANTAIYDAKIDRAAMARLFSRRLNGRVELSIDGHAYRVEDLVKNATRSARGLAVLAEAVDSDIRRTYSDVHSSTASSLGELATDHSSFLQRTIDGVMGSVWRTERPPSRVAEEYVLSRPLWKDLTMEAGWHGVGVRERKRIEAVIRKGVAEGSSMEDIANLIRKSSVYDISKYQARGLVVTAVTSIQTHVDHDIYKANASALVGWQYVAVLDSRTTPLCAHRDGTVYPVSDTVHLPPAHFNCRSTTVPVFKSWEDMGRLEGVAQVRLRNLETLTPKQVAFYDGQTPAREGYDEWLRRQSKEVQLRHIGDYKRMELFQSGQLRLDKFTNPEGNSVGISELRQMSDSGLTPSGDTKRFASAKAQLDSMHLWATSPEDFMADAKLRTTLADYYKLQAGALDGHLSLTNYRGALIGSKRAVRNRVLAMPPRDDQMIFNPITGRYADARLYQPDPAVLSAKMKLVEESEKLLARDKEFIRSFVEGLEGSMGINERAVVADNLRVTMGRARESGELWTNFKAVSNSQMKFDVMNVSDALETNVRKNQDVLKKLLVSDYIDPVLGPSQMREIHDNFVDNILERNRWEDSTAPKIARQLRSVFDKDIAAENPLVWKRLSDRELQQFYLRFANRLSLADMPDRDNFAVALGRDLYNLANLNGDRNKWYKMGMRLLSNSKASKFYEIETYGVQKRRMKSRFGRYFGPYYDTMSYNLRITDPRIQRYAKLNRMIDLGLRTGIIDDDNKLIVRPGYKTFFIDRGILGMEDTRIPIVSSSSFGDFPTSFVDRDFADALNWASEAKYRVDSDYYDFVKKLMYFQDDRGKAEHYNNLNEYRKYIQSRGDSYERFKAMEWLREGNTAFSNHPFVDHRARVYERGFVGPQAGETFRPFLSTAEEKALGHEGFLVLQDQIGAFLGDANDAFEGRMDAMTVSGRQAIAARWRGQMVDIGRSALRGRPADIRSILDSKMASMLDGESLGKFYRLSMEAAKVDEFLKGDYSPRSLARLSNFKTALALEQDASASGAQIIALTTRNMQLAELSNVVPTDRKKRLYDEVAAATYGDPRFKKMNQHLGLTEKDLRKAAKAQNMVTYYGAGERTAALNVEKKLAKVLEREEGTLVVKAADRDTVLNEISARMARYERADPDTYEELRDLRSRVKEVFDRGLDPGDELLDELYFLDPKTMDLVEKMSSAYEKVVTPDDFKNIASIMSEYLSEKTPILRDFTKFFGRLAEDYLANAKPSKADFDWKSIAKITLRGSAKKGYVLPDYLSEFLGLKAGEPVSEKVLKRFGAWDPNGNLRQIVFGVDSPQFRRTGAKYLKVDFVQVKNLFQLEVFYANDLPKSWTTVPWVNFDGKILEQPFTQMVEQRLSYKDKDGTWFTNVLQVPQQTEASWWEQVINKSGKINDIADLGRARTAYAVNGNHSNDATIVKNFHLWGRENGVQTATVHDAFFTNVADMVPAKQALRQIYADSLKGNVVEAILDEMRARGLPKALYEKYMDEAVEKGLIPIPGKSKVGGRTLKESDILRAEDILQDIREDFKNNRSWYGVGP